jgi:ElaA protein
MPGMNDITAGARTAARLAWRFAHFDELTPREVHDLFRLRIEVFVMEQNCPFQDVDGADVDAWHLLGRSGDALHAYCRLLSPGVKFPEASIGRVITSQRARGTGLGKVLMAEALERAGGLWPGQPIRIGAQARLERFYEGFGFRTASDEYIEDGIPHIEMLRP